MSAVGPDSALAPVTNLTRREAVIDAIRRALLNGEIKPGQRLKEVPLAEALGVSRLTIREATGQLIHEGFLVQEPYKGVMVAKPSSQDLVDLAEVRVSLETMAALQIARTNSETHMAQIRKALADHLLAIAEGDVVRVDVTHLAFHRTLWELSGNQILMRIWPLVESQIRLAMSLDQAARSTLEHDAELHVRLVNVLASGDEAAIADEVRNHIALSADEVIRLADASTSNS